VEFHVPPRKTAKLARRRELFKVAHYILGTYVVFTLFNLRLLLITDTELNAMAAPAIIGLNMNPVNGYNKPAATGMAVTL